MGTVTRFEKARRAFHDFTKGLSGPCRAAHVAPHSKDSPSPSVQWTIPVSEQAALLVFLKEHPEYCEFESHLTVKGVITVVRERWNELLRKHNLSPLVTMVGWLKDDPLFDEWKAEVENYRRQCDIEAGIEVQEHA